MEKTRTCEMFVDEFGILHVKILGGVIIDREDAADNFLVARYLTKGQPVLKLVDVRKLFRVKAEARQFVEKENAPDMYIAKAILVGSFLTKYIRELCFNLENAKPPVKIFTSEEEALTWLRTFVS